MNYQINDEIRAYNVLLIDEDGKNLGKIDTREAKRIAQDRGLDLVQVNDNIKNAVCKIADYGKMRYEEQKKDKKKSATQQTKEIRIGFKISDHDLKVKHKQIKKFISKGHKVKYVFKLKGCPQRCQGEALQRLDDFLQDFKDIAHWTKPKQSGSVVVTMLAPQNI
ncbi:MAG: translation initiation factor IF-3 [Atribacterota bacterium]